MLLLLSGEPSGYLPHRLHCRYGIEMYVFYAMGIEVAALFGGPLYSELADIFVGLAFQHLECQGFGQVAMECFWHHAPL